jgi:hypothetical protein
MFPRARDPRSLPNFALALVRVLAERRRGGMSRPGETPTSFLSRRKFLEKLQMQVPSTTREFADIICGDARCSQFKLQACSRAGCAVQSDVRC